MTKTKQKTNVYYTRGVDQIRPITVELPSSETADLVSVSSCCWPACSQRDSYDFAYSQACFFFSLILVFFFIFLFCFCFFSQIFFFFSTLLLRHCIVSGTRISNSCSHFNVNICDAEKIRWPLALKSDNENNCGICGYYRHSGCGLRFRLFLAATSTSDQ